MKFTQEQCDIISSTGDIKINAVAGSGKTTTIIEYARSRPGNSKILYLAFNRSVKLEAIIKFAEKGIENVQVETAHSLAYKHIVFKHNYKVRSQGYKTHEIAQLLGLESQGKKHTKYVVASHINKFISYFCNSDKHRVQDLNYLDTITDTKAKTFVTTFYSYIEKQTRVLLARMDKGDIEITHDFYLKKFQLSKIRLNYDYILFDEAQDASAAMLDVLLKQKATKVMVGDTHQQIYGWRYAINSLEKTNFKTYQLSTSFRFCQEIANLALETLKWKELLDYDHHRTTITGKGKPKKPQTKAVLARTNLGLLLKAIEYVTEKKDLNNIYFEGNINSYTYAAEGASLYDVLNLHTKKKHLIRDKLIKEMNDLEELVEYIKETEDVQLGMMVEIVKKYGKEIPGIINSIKDKHIEGDNKELAEMIFSTVHRCKGMEYDSIQIVNDFTSEEKLQKILADKKKDGIDYNKLNEEINLLYVAITRTKNKLYIPEELVAPGISSSKHISIIKSTGPAGQSGQAITERTVQGVEEKAYSVGQVRRKHKAAYQPWTQVLDDELTVLYCEGESIGSLAKHFGRTRGAIRSRIKKLELADIYD